jgi:hypothetical protein
VAGEGNPALAENGFYFYDMFMVKELGRFQ